MIDLPLHSIKYVITGSHCASCSGKYFNCQKAAQLIHIEYDPLPVVNSPLQGLEENAPLVHENLLDYTKDEGIYPVEGTNIINHTKIRKGDIQAGLQEGEVKIESHFSIPLSDHAAMETRPLSVKFWKAGLSEL